MLLQNRRIWKWSKILCQINQEILKASRNNHRSWKALQLLCTWLEGFAEGILQVVLFTVLCFKWSVKKHCVTKILQGSWERFLYENSCKFNSYKFSYKFTFILFFVLSYNPKARMKFSFGGLVTRNSFAFCL